MHRSGATTLIFISTLKRCYLLFRIIYLVLIISVWHSQCAATEHSASKTEPLVIAVTDDEGPPFFALDPITQKPIGIFADILGQLGSAMGLQVTFLATARNKIEDEIISNRADGTFLAPQWVQRPNKLVFTDPILIHKQYFYSLSPLVSIRASRSNLRDVLKGKAVCIRQDYLYPELDKLFQQKILVRTDVSNRDRLINMLIDKRCELIYMNDIHTQWVLATQRLPRAVFRSPKSLAADKVPLALSTKWASRLSEFNRQINKLHLTGEIQRIVQQNITRKMAQGNSTL